MTPSLTVEQILRDNYVDGVFHTHVSMVQPRGKFQFNRQKLEMFWDVYCERIITDEEVILGVAEKPQHYLPVLADIDLKVKDIDESNFQDTLYSVEHVNKVVGIYQTILRNIVEGCTDDNLLCVLLEKPLYYITSNETAYVKHGFHLHFPNLFLNKIDQEVHVIPRVQQMVREMNIFADLGIEDSGLVIDKASCTVPWLMYGSRKSENMDPYKVTKVFNSEGDELELEDAFKNYQLFDMKETLIPIRGKVKEFLPRILSIIPYGRKTKDIRNNISCPIKEQLRKRIVDKKYDKKTVDENLKLTSKILPMLSLYRVNDRNQWITIGWCLFNIGMGCYDALEQWIEFSSRGENFSEAVCIYEWEKMETKNLTIGTLKHYAKNDSPDKYDKLLKELNKSSITKVLNRSTHSSIAKVLYNKYPEEFICASIDRKIWYRYVKQTWDQDDSGITLRCRINNALIPEFSELITMYLKYKSESEDDAEKLSKDIADIKAKPSAKIYDTLVHYKALIPKDNESFRKFALMWWGREPRPEGFTTERNHAERWQAYDEDEAERARTVVQDIIDRYFPDGRPEA